PVQDYLGYDTSARINEPSTLGKNWRWRMSREDLNEDTVKRCRRLAGIYGRLGEA
ncbi:MAG: 4-alpha-glucanotransferase, partial [Enterocloster bolteae]